MLHVTRSISHRLPRQLGVCTRTQIVHSIANISNIGDSYTPFSRISSECSSYNSVRTFSTDDGAHTLPPYTAMETVMFEHTNIMPLTMKREDIVNDYSFKLYSHYTPHPSDFIDASDGVTIPENDFLNDGFDLNRRTAAGVTPLIHSVLVNRKDIMEHILDQSVDVNDTDINKCSALHWVAHQGTPEMVATLIKHKAYIDSSDSRGQTPLMIAAAQGNSDVLQVLLEYGARVALVRDHRGFSVLMHAITSKSIDIVQTIIEYETDLEVVDHEGCTALIWAIRMAAQDISLLLLQKYDCSARTRTIHQQAPIHFAAVAGQHDVVTAIMKKRVNINLRDRHRASPLMLASFYDHNRIVETLVDSKADLHARSRSDDTHLHGAVLNQSRKAVMKLLEYKQTEVNARNSKFLTPVAMAIATNNQFITRKLIEERADLNTLYERRQSLLHLAAFSDKNGIVTKFLLNFLHPSVDLLSNDRVTALMIATMYDNIAACTALLSRGADPNIPDDEGVFPLSLACKLKKADMVQLLLDHSADPNCTSQYGEWIVYAPLLIATFARDEPAVAALLKAKAEVNARGPGQSTALHMACKHGDVAIAKLLLQHGASTKLRNDDFASASSFAKESDNADELLQLLNDA